MPIFLCEQCGVRPASVFYTQLLGDSASQHQLCGDCARFMSDAPHDAAHFSHGYDEAAMLHQAFRDAENQMRSAYDAAYDAPENVVLPPSSHPAQGTMEWFLKLNELPDAEETRRVEQRGQHAANLAASNSRDDEDAGEKDAEEIAPLSSEDIENLLPAKSSTRNAAPAAPIASVRCPKCDTTWDRLKQDGRAGCAQCYVAFARELANVMERVQKTSQHQGKTPREMEKRRRRLVHLRQRRDNRLEMLQRRLQESLERENYEEAAKLRDKIKIVSATVLDA